MNTVGIQNYLSNVFRPIYTFDTTTSNFTPKLELSNIDNYSGNTISVFTAAIGDSKSNVYVGSNAGNAFNITRNCSNVTALGYGAASNVSNVSNSVFLGWYAGASTSNTIDVISIGKRSGGNGSANILIGTNTGLSNVGTCNILIGHYIDLSGASNQIRIGYSNQIPIAADLSKNWVGLGGYTAPVNSNDKFDVSGNMYLLGNIGLNTAPGVSATLDVNGDFQSDDGYAKLRFLTTGSNSDLAFSNYTGGTTTVNIGGKTTSTTGFTSIQSNISAVIGVTSIGPIKKGIINVSVVDQASSTNRAAYIYFAWTTSNVTTLSSTSNGETDITTSSTDIQISNTVGIKTYDYSITYFPLP